jgi:translation initiation factor IF-3
VGIVEISDALARAVAAGMDLVEVAPTAKPPVCRIMDYGKWKYAERKKERKSRAHRHETEMKEVRIRTPKIGEHDLGIKITHARGFLIRGDRVQFLLRFRGRELAHIDEGQKVFERIKQDLADVSKVEQGFRREGRRITMLLVPGVTKKAEPAKAPATKPPATAKPAGASPPPPQPPAATEAPPAPAEPPPAPPADPVS